MSIFHEELEPKEAFWVENYTHLLALGFRLRPRYSPNWKPSWIMPDGSKRPEPLSMFEDAYFKCVRVCIPTSVQLIPFQEQVKTDKIMDATRLSDDAQVVLRKADTNKAEYLMLKKLNSPELQCSANHTVPLLGVLPLPGSGATVLLVMPKLMRFSHPNFETRGEIVEAICQIIEVSSLLYRQHPKILMNIQSIAFMHSLNIAHLYVYKNIFHIMAQHFVATFLP